jgi:hypothetical protein
MVAEKREKLCLTDGREVWRYTFVRYRDAASGKFISNQELGEDPAPGLGSRPVPDLDQIEDQLLSTLLEIAAVPELVVKSSSSMKMLIGLVDKLKREKAANQEEEWFILGRQLAKEVLALLEEEGSGSQK